MIQANISSYIGQDADAEHYYCHIHVIEGNIPPKQYNGGSWGTEQLQYELTEAEAVRLNKKDNEVGFSCFRYKAGTSVGRFESIKQIHEELLKQYPNQDIVSYNECIPFKEMLCIVDGVDHGVKYFGEFFVNVPRSCYEDLIPETHKIRCHFCNKEYALEDVSSKNNWRGRTIVNFAKKYDVIDACKCFDLEWNVIL